MTARKHGEIAAIRVFDIGQEVQRLDRDRTAGFRDPHFALAFPAIGMRISWKASGRCSNDCLGHTEHNVRPHDIDNQVKDRRLIDKIDKSLMVR